MKRIIPVFVILIITLAASCSDDDNMNPVFYNSNTQEADGKWHLIQVTGGIAGINHLFEPSTITWTFSENDDSVTVENTNINESLQDFFDSGTYNISVLANDQVPANCNFLLIIDNVDFGCRDIVNDNMTLTQQVADGYELKFTK